MNKEEFEQRKSSVRIIYDYIRGSHAYGLNTETSDVDTACVYIAPTDEVIGLRANYQEQFADEKNDNVVYEVGRFLELLEKSNPTMLESLFIPERCIMHKDAIMDEIIAQRDMFLSKEALKSLHEYSKAQVKKASGYKKKIVNPITVRKGILDFVYTFRHQGTTPIQKWMGERGLMVKYCGLVHLPNMDQMYGVYYDWVAHAQDLGMKNMYDIDESRPETVRLSESFAKMANHTKYFESQLSKWQREHYRGMIDEENETTQLRLSSIDDKDATPICHIQYNENGFQSHCRDYREYQEWVAKRNQQRFSDNEGYRFDAKNMCHVIRLLTMSVELATGKGFNIDRSVMGDRQYLLDIKLHKYTYEQIMKDADRLTDEFNEAMKTCTLPDKVDHEKVNALLIKIRRMQMENERKMTKKFAKYID